MKRQDWALFLIIGIGAYAGGFLIGNRPGLFFRVIIDPPIQLRLVVDTVELVFPKNPTVEIHLEVAKSVEEFRELAKTSDLLLARPQWLLNLEQKPFPVYRSFPALSEFIHPLFLQSAFQDQQIVPLLWGVQELFNGVNDAEKKWKFQPAGLSGVMLGLILMDNPTVAQLTRLSPTQNRNLAVAVVQGLSASGLGLALAPQDPALERLIPPSQKAARIAEFELSRFEMKQ
jgi:hypothetical protein